MKILVVGSGGREHAIVSALARSQRRPQVLCAPGNAGITREATVVEAALDSPAGVEKLRDLAVRERVDLVVVGPEAPLVLGLADRLEAAGIRVFGPQAAAAQLEGSKCFTKEFLARHAIPTSPFRIFEEAGPARAYVERVGLPVVLKADGLAAGKGVIVARERGEALEAVEAILVERRFGEAGRRLLVEGFLEGSEISLLLLTDGEAFAPLETAQDYKQALDGDAGPNTGGMGCYSPHLRLDDPEIEAALERIVKPTLAALRRDGIRYRGILYAGLMLTPDGPQVLEFNVRFGDPEAQAILARLQTDLVEAIERTIEGRLADQPLAWDPRPAVCVVAASGGYPGEYRTGVPITGLEAAEAAGARVYHAGTKLDGRGQVVTSGGRVLSVTALGATREEARERAYAGLSCIHFDGMHYRRDIAGSPR